MSSEKHTIQHFQMINVGAKPETFRQAIAQGEIFVGKTAFELIATRQLPKGDALVLAEIAGITGAKKASDLIPLCHPMSLDHVSIQLHLDPERSVISVYCTAATVAKTGVEMEALAGVNAALLALYDLTKMIEPALTISNIRLVSKEGGKSGYWLHPDGVIDDMQHLIKKPVKTLFLDKVRVAIITVSDRAFAKKYADESGKILRESLESLGADICDVAIVPDEGVQLTAQIQALMANHPPQLIVTTGGTGLAPRDITPEVLINLADRVIDGFGELLRHESAQYHTPFAWLSRCLAVSIKRTLIIALPGRPKAVAEGVAIFKDLLPHAFTMLNAGNHD